MEYKYGQNQNYEDFSSGRVLYHGEGMTNFPVRLAQEIYGRCLEYSPKKSHITLYDCCCGGGYLLTVLGFLNQDSIGKIIGSDINEEILHTARKNLSLLTLEGIDKRIKELEEMILNFEKQSHIDAKNSAIRLKSMIKSNIKFKKEGKKRKEEYIKIFPTDPKYQRNDTIQIEEFMKNLRSNPNTNMDEFIEFCINISKSNNIQIN